MPSFSRKMWVSDQAREIWMKKFVQFAECWRQIEWLTVANGIRSCALFFISQQELAGLALVLRKLGLKTVVVSAHIQADQRQNSLCFRTVAGRAKDLRAFCKAWKLGDDETMGRLLGYPPCCRSFFHRVFVQEGLTDCIWPMGSSASESPSDAQTIYVNSIPELNPFWIAVGIRLVPHYACRFDCPKAASFAREFIAVGNEAGYGTFMETALEVLQWPVEWSCLHGIVEIRTPILKISQQSDFTRSKLTINLLSRSFPKEGAAGLCVAPD